jgi:hypothetical protein
MYVQLFSSTVTSISIFLAALAFVLNSRSGLVKRIVDKPYWEPLSRTLAIAAAIMGSFVMISSACAMVRDSAGSSTLESSVNSAPKTIKSTAVSAQISPWTFPTWYRVALIAAFVVLFILLFSYVWRMAYLTSSEAVADRLSDANRRPEEPLNSKPLDSLAQLLLEAMKSGDYEPFRLYCESIKKIGVQEKAYTIESAKKLREVFLSVTADREFMLISVHSFQDMLDELTPSKKQLEDSSRTLLNVEVDMLCHHLQQPRVSKTVVDHIVNHILTFSDALESNLKNAGSRRALENYVQRLSTIFNSLVVFEPEIESSVQRLFNLYLGSFSRKDLQRPESRAVLLSLPPKEAIVMRIILRCTPQEWLRQNRHAAESIATNVFNTYWDSLPTREGLDLWNRLDGIRRISVGISEAILKDSALIGDKRTRSFVSAESFLDLLVAKICGKEFSVLFRVSTCLEAMRPKGAFMNFGVGGLELIKDLGSVTSEEWSGVFSTDDYGATLGELFMTFSWSDFDTSHLGDDENEVQLIAYKWLFAAIVGDSEFDGESWIHLTNLVVDRDERSNRNRNHPSVDQDVCVLVRERVPGLLSEWKQSGLTFDNIGPILNAIRLLIYVAKLEKDMKVARSILTADVVCKLVEKCTDVELNQQFVEDQFNGFQTTEDWMGSTSRLLEYCQLSLVRGFKSLDKMRLIKGENEFLEQFGFDLILSKVLLLSLENRAGGGSPLSDELDEFEIEGFESGIDGLEDIENHKDENPADLSNLSPEKVLASSIIHLLLDLRKKGRDRRKQNQDTSSIDEQIQEREKQAITCLARLELSIDAKKTIQGLTDKDLNALRNVVLSGISLGSSDRDEAGSLISQIPSSLLWGWLVFLFVLSRPMSEDERRSAESELKARIQNEPEIKNEIEKQLVEREIMASRSVSSQVIKLVKNADPKSKQSTSGSTLDESTGKNQVGKRGRKRRFRSSTNKK